MNPNLIEKLQDFFQTNPITKGEPSTAEELFLEEQTMQLKLDETHRYLLLHYGGVVIGDIRIYGLKNAELIGDETFVELTNDFREQMSIEAQQYVISVDDMANYTRVAKLDSPYAESMVSSFIRYYNRIGYPDIDSELILKAL